MLTETLRTPTPDGDAEALLLLPDQRTPAPLVVFLMDAFGLRPALTDMAARLVSAGYAVLQPNLYWRSGPFAPFDARTTFNDAPERTRIFALMNGFTAAQVGADLDAHLAALADHPAVRPGPVGLIGYCMGGRQAFYIAAHLGASRIRARCYFAVADRDNSCTEADCVTLGESLTGAGVTHTIELYPDALHGFAAPDMSVFDEAAADRHWTRVLALFAETLGR
jgi:carboxymethylenebutenolidase